MNASSDLQFSFVTLQNTQGVGERLREGAGWGIKCLYQHTFKNKHGFTDLWAGCWGRWGS